LARLALKVGLVLFLSVFLFGASSEALNKDEASVAPNTKGGKKWRIGYCESNRFVNYADHLYALVRGLTETGWIRGTEGFPYSPGQDDTGPMWQWLASHDLGPYIEFVGDAYYTYDGMNPDLRSITTGGIAERLNDRRDIDMMLVMGTVAGRLLATDAHNVPVMVFSTSNAVQAGIVKSAGVSGSQHVWAHMYPTRFRRQLEVFHDIFPFKKLGIVYEDSEAGRTLAALKEVEGVAADRGFDVVRCFVNDNQPDREAFFREMLEAHRKLSREVDAMYMTVYPGSRKFDMLPRLLEPFYQNSIPVFSQLKQEVQYGALISVADSDFIGIGQFGAEAVARVLNGESTGGLPQVYESTPYIVLNLEVAKKIGYRPPFEILLVADKIHREVESR